MERLLWGAEGSRPPRTVGALWGCFLGVHAWAGTRGAPSLCSSCPLLPLSSTFSGIFFQSRSLGHCAFSLSHNSFLPIPAPSSKGVFSPEISFRAGEGCCHRALEAPFWAYHPVLGGGRECMRVGMGLSVGTCLPPGVGSVSCWWAQGQERGYSNARVGVPRTVRGGKEQRKSSVLTPPSALHPMAILGSAQAGEPRPLQCPVPSTHQSHLPVPFFQHLEHLPNTSSSRAGPPDLYPGTGAPRKNVCPGGKTGR